MRTYLIILLTTLSLNSFAEGGPESWYINLGFGTSSDTFPDAVETALSAADGTDMSLALDFGFYWPIFGESTILGFAIDANGYQMTTGFATLGIYTYIYAASLMHFFGEYAGKGLYLRGDFGVTKGVIDGSGLTAVSETGTGFMAEVGWGFAISDETRILLGGYYSSKTIEGASYDAKGIKITWLF